MKAKISAACVQHDRCETASSCGIPRNPPSSGAVRLGPWRDRAVFWVVALTAVYMHAARTSADDLTLPHARPALPRVPHLAFLGGRKRAGVDAAEQVPVQEVAVHAVLRGRVHQGRSVCAETAVGQHETVWCDAVYQQCRITNSAVSSFCGRSTFLAPILANGRVTPTSTLCFCCTPESV